MAQIETISQMFTVFRQVCERPVIKTSFDNPPVPTRRFDWAAWYDDLGEDGSPIGQGATEQEAIDDLISKAER